MSCSKVLDFAAPVGAHLSFYWTMDEGGAVNRIDSAAGLAWPLVHGGTATPGLFSNGVELPAGGLLNQNPGAVTFANPNITIDQATSTGLSAWWWIKLNAYGNAGSGGNFDLDTDDVMHTNRFQLTWGFTDALNGGMEVDHTNDTDDVFVDTPNLTWTLGTWHMVAITYDKAAQTLNIYIDGALSASIADAFVYPDLTLADMLLTNFAAPGHTLDQVVDEFGLSTKGALTPAQVTALWNGGVGVTWPNVTPIVPYP